MLDKINTFYEQDVKEDTGMLSNRRKAEEDSGSNRRKVVEDTSLRVDSTKNAHVKQIFKTFSLRDRSKLKKPRMALFILGSIFNNRATRLSQ